MYVMISKDARVVYPFCPSLLPSDNASRLVRFQNIKQTGNKGFTLCSQIAVTFSRTASYEISEASVAWISVQMPTRALRRASLEEA